MHCTLLITLLRDYAESIEQQLKAVNLLVDLLYPPPDIPATQVLRDLSQCNCLYAIFITGENESHRSLTLNILHGTPQGETGYGRSDRESLTTKARDT